MERMEFNRVRGSLLALLAAAALSGGLPGDGLAQETDPEPDPVVEQTDAETTVTPTTQVDSPASQEKARTGEQGDDLLTTARASGNLTRFAALVEKAGLAEDLSEGGPYTIFAPTDEAFEKATQAAADEDSKPQKELLTLLRTHIAAGEWTSEDLSSADHITNLLADDLQLKWKESDGEADRRPLIEGAHVVRADVEFANGVIHQIDAVLEPSATPEMSTDVADVSSDKADTEDPDDAGDASDGAEPTASAADGEASTR